MSPVVRAAGAAAAAKTSAPAKTRAAAKPAAKATGKKKKIAGASKIRGKELPGFSRQLAAMLGAGMPIVAALDTLEEQAENPNFKSVLLEIKDSIENGAAFSESLRQFPTVFDDLYVNMVHGGETGGQLAETVARIADLLESTAALRRKVKSAMSYPTIVLCLAMVIAFALITFIVPVFAEIYEGFGKGLPGPTQVLVTMSNFLRKYLIWVLTGFAVFVVVFRKWSKTKQGEYILHQLALKAPVFGVLIQKVAVARFARTFSQLVRSGVPIMSTLDIVSGATGNRVIERALREGRGVVERGDSLSSGLQDKNCIPKMVVRMLAAGEKTGKVDEMMESIADYYEDEVEAMLSGLTSLIEPLLMVFLGVVIGGIVICMFLPIFKMHEIISM